MKNLAALADTSAVVTITGRSDITASSVKAILGAEIDVSTLH